MSIYIEVLVNGLVLGGVYGLLSSGLAFTWHVLGIPNASQSAYAILAAFISYWLFVLYGVSPFIFVIPMSVAFALGFFYRRFLITRFKDSPPLMIFVVTYIMAILIEGFMVMFWGSEDHRIPLIFAPVQIFGVYIPFVRLLALVISIVVFIAFALFLKYHHVGKAMRAIGQNPDAAAVVGINVELLSDIAAGIGASLAGVAGPLLGLIYSFNPSHQALWLGKIFCIVLLGGIESIYAALLAGFLLGVIETVSAIFLPVLISYIISYGLLLLVLLIRFRRV